MRCHGRHGWIRYNVTTIKNNLRFVWRKLNRVFKKQDREQAQEECKNERRSREEEM